MDRVIRCLWIGFDAGVARVPIVPAAVLFDLGVGDPRARPGPEDGYAACVAAGEDVQQGNVGAGTGATVANLKGPEGAVKGGLGTASARRDDLVVGALVAVNAFGEVLDEQGGVLAGSRVEGPAAQTAFPGTSRAPGPGNPNRASTRSVPVPPMQNVAASPTLLTLARRSESVEVRMPARPTRVTGVAKHGRVVSSSQHRSLIPPRASMQTIAPVAESTD